MPNEVKLEAPSQKILLSLEEGVSATSMVGGDANFVWNGNAQQASSNWAIHHGLNKYCSVTVVDDDDNVVVADVVYVDANNIEIHFAAAVTGKAYLN